MHDINIKETKCKTSILALSFFLSTSILHRRLRRLKDRGSSWRLNPTEGENTGRHECTNDIDKVKRKVSNLQQQAKYKTHRSSKSHLSMKYVKVNVSSPRGGVNR